MIREIFVTLFNNEKLINFIRSHPFLDKSSKIFWHFFRDHLIGQNSRKVVKIDIDGNSFKILSDPRNGLIDKTIVSLRVYEPKISKLIKKYSDKNSVFVDIGANIGYHSLYASLFFKKVIAFEPMPPLFTQFKKSIKLNNFTNIIVHNFACSDKEKRTLIYYRDDLGGASLNDAFAKENHSKKCQSLEIKTVALDHFLRSEKSIRLIKMDVECHEPFVIKGMKAIIKKHKPFIIMEFSPQDLNKIKKNKALNFLRSMKKDYDLIDVSTEKNILNLKKYIEQIEKKKYVAAPDLFLIHKSRIKHTDSKLIEK